MITRHLAWEACYNARDLGGLPTRDGKQTRWRALVRSDDSSRLSPQGRAAVVDYGVLTVIDLRGADELDSAPSPFAAGGHANGSVTYLHRPIVDLANREALARLRNARTLAEDAMLMVDLFQRQVATIITDFAGAPDGGVLIHCHAGKDRTGVVIALLLSLAGVDDGNIADDYARSTIRLQPYYEAQVRSGAIQPSSWLEAVPETVLTLLSHLRDRYGGTQGYLLRAGVTPAAIGLARARLKE